MTSRAFLDTNVLVYLFDNQEPAKQLRSREILIDASIQLVVSTQVLGEFYVVSTRKLARPLDPSQAAVEVERFSELPVVATDSDLVRSAIATSRESQLSYWDALIVEAAAVAGCDRLYTEDLGDGDVVRGVRIENPFRAG